MLYWPSLLGQDGWILASFFFCVFMDLDFVSVYKHAKKELGQYPAILASRLFNNPYIFTTNSTFQYEYEMHIVSGFPAVKIVLIGFSFPEFPLPRYSRPQEPGSFLSAPRKSTFCQFRIPGSHFGRPVVINAGLTKRPEILSQNSVNKKVYDKLKPLT